MGTAGVSSGTADTAAAPQRCYGLGSPTQEEEKQRQPLQKNRRKAKRTQVSLEKQDCHETTATQ